MRCSPGWSTLALLALLPVAIGCSSDPADRRELLVYNAGSLARPLKAALDTFSARNDVRISQENAGSLEAARKLTELGQIPDLIVLADYEVFPRLLMPDHVSWFVTIARNRMVIGFTDRSRGVVELTPANWMDVLSRADVDVGRSDPSLDPAGYRTLMLLQLAELHYSRPGLSQQLLARATERNMRPKSADIVALVQAGEIDYMFGYESVARAAGLRFINLPQEIDLGSPSLAASYGRARVTVPGLSRSDSVTFTAQPIAYALSIPDAAPRPVLAEQFVEFLLSAEGKRILRAHELDALEQPVLFGSAPPAVRAAVEAAGRGSGR